MLFIEQNRILPLLLAEEFILIYFILFNHISIGQINVFGGEKYVHVRVCIGGLYYAGTCGDLRLILQGLPQCSTAMDD